MLIIGKPGQLYMEGGINLNKASDTDLRDGSLVGTEEPIENSVTRWTWAKLKI